LLESQVVAQNQVAAQNQAVEMVEVAQNPVANLQVIEKKTLKKPSFINTYLYLFVFNYRIKWRKI
jgi:hypothetical protein